MGFVTDVERRMVQKAEERQALLAIAKRLDFRPRPPYPLKPRKLRKLQGAKVTIAAGFCCQGGIVLCADTQMTVPGELKTYQTKLRAFEDAGLSVVLAGAGNVNYMTMTFQKIMRRLASVNPTPSEIREAFEETILEVHGTHIAILPAEWEKPRISLLLGFRTPSGASGLFSSEDAAVYASDSFVMHGSGSVLGQAIATPLYQPTITLQQGVILAAYVVAQAKKHVDGCGGKTDILTIGTDGAVTAEYGLSLAELEAQFDLFNSAAAAILLGFSDSTISDEEFSKSLEEFNNRLRALRKPTSALRFLDRLDSL